MTTRSSARILFLERVDQYITRTSLNGCWLWRGELDSEGDPVYEGTKLCVTLHACYSGIIRRRNQVVVHECGVKLCCQPDHLKYSFPWVLQRSKIHPSHYKKKDKEAARIARRTYTLKTKYNMTPEQYQHKLDHANGCCEICENPLIVKQSTCLDHNHKTGQVRGILCSACNSMLGFSKEKIDTLQRAIMYLQKYGEEQ